VRGGNVAKGHPPMPVELSKLPDTPLVSVLVANYNYGRFLREMADSVLNQTYANWELIICDDGSTDNSREVLDSLTGLDQRVRVLHQENGGQASALNTAFRESIGDIIVLLDPDDWFTTDKIERSVQALRDNPNSGFVHHQCRTTDAAGHPFGPPLPDPIRSGWLYPLALERGGHAFTAKTSEIALRREIAEIAFPIPDELRYGYGDGHVSRIATFLTEITAIPMTLSYYRLHGENFCGGAVVDGLDASSLDKWAEGYLIHFRNTREFVRERFGEESANELRLSDISELWDLLGRLYVLRGQPDGGVMGISPEQIKQNLARSRKRLLWKLCFTLPHPLSLWLLRAQVRSLQDLRSLGRRAGRVLSRKHGGES
jgi:glycosyltransferase involved in cell wall biosynthesis